MITQILDPTHLSINSNNGQRHLEAVSERVVVPKGSNCDAMFRRRMMWRTIGKNVCGVSFASATESRENTIIPAILPIGAAQVLI